MITVEATNRTRHGWTAQVEVNAGRVTGDLFRPDGSVCRNGFNVRMKSNGCFAVDIGTGSGVKINFQIPDADQV